MISSTPPASGRKVFGEATNKNIEKVQAVKPKSILPAFHLVSDYADLPPEVPHPPPPRAARRRSKPAGLCGKCQVQYGRGREASDVWAALLHCSRATHALQALNPPDYGSDPAMMLTDFSAITSGASLHSSDPLYNCADPALPPRSMCVWLPLACRSQLPHGQALIRPPPQLPEPVPGRAEPGPEVQGSTAG